MDSAFPASTFLEYYSLIWVALTILKWLFVFFKKTEMNMISYICKPHWQHMSAAENVLKIGMLKINKQDILVI